MHSPTDERAPAAARLWWGALGLWLGLALGSTLALWHMRRDGLAGQARELGLLSLALADEIDRGLQDVEQGLHAMRDELAEGRLPVAGAAAVQALRTRADLLPLVGTLWLVDGGGRVLSASSTEP